MEEVRKRQILYDITYKCVCVCVCVCVYNLKYNTNEPNYEAEADTKTQRTDLRLPREKGLCVGGWTRSLGLIDANYYIWSRQKKRFYFIVQGTIFNILG